MKGVEDWRKGQIAFNFVYAVDPDLADLVRGNVDIDPFHRDVNLDVFWEFVRAETWRRENVEEDDMNKDEQDV